MTKNTTTLLELAGIEIEERSPRLVDAIAQLTRCPICRKQFMSIYAERCCDCEDGCYNSNR
jgi:hypothetical protein